MLTFVLLAAALTVGGIALVAVPLVRAPATAGAPAPWSALAAAGVLAVGAAALYVLWSNWSWHAPPPADAPESMVAQLARKLEHNPDDLDGWLMLGRSYVALQEYPLAYRAYTRADRLAGGKNVEALLGEAQALAMSDPGELDGRAARLIERALTLDPNSGKALFFGALVAARRGELPLARERFTRVLALNPPDAVRAFLVQQVAAIDRQTNAAPPPDTAASAPSTAAVRVRVTLSPALRESVGAFPLFVFVRDPAQPGPPLAVRKLASQFPQTVELTARDSMVAGRSFAPGQRVAVVARIARSGSPVGASGDPYGEISYQVGKDGLVTLSIDRLTP
jgi:cytochrome c-type biogenesis protein CcmH